MRRTKFSAYSYFASPVGICEISFILGFFIASVAFSMGGVYLYTQVREFFGFTWSEKIILVLLSVTGGIITAFLIICMNRVIHRKARYLPQSVHKQLRDEEYGNPNKVR